MREYFKIRNSWKTILAPVFKSKAMDELEKFIANELAAGKTIYPESKNIFQAFELCPWEQLKVVIIGQDPYHGEGQAHGLSFSVPAGIKAPPSLINIFKEMQQDLGLNRPTHGYLKLWAQQGVLLLNSVLTVEQDRPGSHRGQGWEIFTDFVIETINREKSHIVFILWGKDAQAKGSKIDATKHLVIEAAHPSPFSATKFFGHQPFSRTNNYLLIHQRDQINWKLT